MSLYELRWAVPSVPSSWMCLGGWEAATCPSGSIWEGSLVLPSLHAHHPGREHTVGLCPGVMVRQRTSCIHTIRCPVWFTNIVSTLTCFPSVLPFLRSYVQSGLA